MALNGLLLALMVTACTHEPPTGPERGPVPVAGPSDIQVPPYARWPYQPFSREAVVQIALREWRAFGQQVVYPDTELPFDNERLEGLWQRVGDYWWLGLPMGADEQGLTGKHNQNGYVFPAAQDRTYAWSAAFVSYVMRMAGAGSRFPYSEVHSTYINAARLNPGRLVVVAMQPEFYAPQRGDLICLSRGRRMRFDELPTGRFASHCDIVVATRPGMLDVVGGNVENSVSMRHIPVTLDGRLVGSDGKVIDPNHLWFVVLRISYDAG